MIQRPLDARLICSLNAGKQAKRIATWYHSSCDTGQRMAHALPDDPLSATDDEEPAMPSTHFVGTRPQMYPARQLLYSAPIADIPGTVDAELRRAGLAEAIRPGQRVAITAGSRGINNIAAILKAAVDAVRQVGAEPFLVPAMGSHGGATAEGQAALLAESFGVG